MALNEKENLDDPSLDKLLREEVIFLRSLVRDLEEENRILKSELRSLHFKFGDIE